MAPRKKQSRREERRATKRLQPRSPQWPTAIHVPGYCVPLLLVAVTVLAYLPAMRGGLIWDDRAHITRPELQSLPGLARIWFDLGVTQQYYPLVHSAFWLEHKLWGDSVLGYHLANVLLHSAAASLVYAVLRRLKIPGALLAATIFAVHPVHVESVAWITEQKNTLSAVFYLGAMLAYLQFDQWREKRSYAIAFGLFVLGLLTKTVTATLPAALLVIFWWQRGRLSWRRDALPLVPFFACAAVAGAFTAWVERRLIGAEGAAFELSVLQRGLLAGRAIWFYVAKLLWPANLIFIYPRWQVDPAVWWQWLFPIGVLTLFAVLWAIRNRWRAPLAGGLFFVGTLFPALGFLNVYPFIYSFVADHFQYLASLGVIVLVAAGTTYWLERMPRPARRLGNVVSVGLVGALAGLTWNQCRMYSDSVALYQTTIDRNPTCWMAHNNLGDQHMLAQRLPQAIDEFEAALGLNPNCGEAHGNLGIALASSGRLKDGIEHCREAVRLQPSIANGHRNLANLLLASGQTQEAIERYRQALELTPHDAETWMDLASALERADRIQEAADAYRRASELRPDFFEAHFHLANVLVRLGTTHEAIDQYEESLRLNPDSADAYYNLGTALAAIDQPQAAIDAFEHALGLNPNDADICLGLADVYQGAGRSEEAVATARKALGLARRQGATAEIQQIEAWLNDHSESTGHEQEN